MSLVTGDGIWAERWSG